jgi:hypothetical protein
MLISGIIFIHSSRDGILSSITTACTTKMMISMKHYLWWMVKMKSTSSYSTVGYSKSVFNGYLNLLKRLIDFEKCKDPYKGMRIAEVVFKEPYLRCADYEVIALVVMRLLMKYAYNTGIEYSGKFTVGYVMKIPTGDVTYTIGSAISLNDSSNKAIPNMNVYIKLLKFVAKKAEDYDKAVLTAVFIRVYHNHPGMQEVLPLSSDEIDTQLWQLLNAGIVGDEPQEVKAMGRKSRYPDHIPALKPTSKERRPFIVADTETVINNNVHEPYAAGFLVVKPGEDVGAKPDDSIETYFSEDHEFFIPEFKDRSNRMMFDFLERLAVVAAETKIRTVYFHNFSRFDGILLMKYYASHGDKYSIKPLMRNHRLYELSVYRGKKRLYRLRDSYTLLTTKLATLAKTLCPELGSKGSIAHDEVQVSNLKKLSAKLLDYMKQDIRLLGGVMLKAQDIYWTQYKVDIENCLTLSALAMKIYRIRYYDPNSFPIHIPSRNEDTFIRRGYYGGHADTYIPYGENLYYYDVNSLYPYIMKTFPMPPVWHGNFEDQELSNLYGFIEAYVECPTTINRPFLPYRDHNNTLLFPTGSFVGVYFSEELIYARNLGYTIIPLRGYLFEKKPSPFDSFVSSLFGSRLEAKKAGNVAMAYVYKLIMNSLYGRFGINPKSTITEICNRERYDYLILRKDNLISGDQLSEYYYIVSYVSNKGNVDDSDWNPPTISAVQIAAAITACSRIHMYQYISRPDCYYTDTDSAILGSPLPEDEISSELGKLKMEYFVKKGIFLAPKSYLLVTEEAGNIMKHKGPAKDLVNVEWFESQYADMSRTKQVTLTSKFRIDWNTLNIVQKDYIINHGIQVGNKRDPVYNNKNAWVGTRPKNVTDLGGEEYLIFKLKYKKILLEKSLRSRRDKKPKGKKPKGKKPKGKGKKPKENDTS